MEQEFCKRVERWVDAHEREILEEVKKLVSIESVAQLDSEVKPYGQGCRRVMEEYCRLARRLGYTTISYDDRVIRVDTDELVGTPGLGVWNHLDVVPAGPDWRYEPYRPMEVNGLLIGRGVRDNKGPAVAALYAVKCLKELGAAPKYKLSLYAGLEEETKMSDIHWMQENGGEFAKVNLVLDSRFPVCYGEKGMLNVKMANSKQLSERILKLQGGDSGNSVPARAKLCVRVPEAIGCAGLAKRLAARVPEWLSVTGAEEVLTIEAKGISKHSAHPEGSVNALYRLFAAVSGKADGCETLADALLGILGAETMELLAEEERLTFGSFGEGLGIETEDEISGKLTCVAISATLQEGICTVSFNIRYPILLKAPDSLIEGVKKRVEGSDFRLICAEGKRPGYFSKEHPLIQSLMRSYNSYMGEEREPFTIAGGTYAKLLPNGFGYGFRIVPEPSYPEGLIPEGHGGNHAADEAVDIAWYKKQLALLIVSLADSRELAL